MVIARVIECHLCGYARINYEDGRMFDEACACLTPECQGERGDECELVLLCTDCLWAKGGLMGRKVVCNYCHGNKVIRRQKSNGTWVTETCPACNGRGVVDTSTI